MVRLKQFEGKRKGSGTNEFSEVLGLRRRPRPFTTGCRKSVVPVFSLSLWHPLPDQFSRYQSRWVSIGFFHRGPTVNFVYIGSRWVSDEVFRSIFCKNFGLPEDCVTVEKWWVSEKGNFGKSGKGCFKSANCAETIWNCLRANCAETIWNQSWKQGLFTWRRARRPGINRTICWYNT